MKFANCGLAARRSFALGMVAALVMVPNASLSQMFTPMKPPSENAPAGQEQRPSSDADRVETVVTYAIDQAVRGEGRYMSECEDCHGDDLRGGMNGGAPLRGLAFEEKFATGAPASVMFSYMAATMPPNAPGRYSLDVYADLMAYILQRNGFRPGAPLPSDMDALDYLLVEK